MVQLALLLTNSELRNRDSGILIRDSGGAMSAGISCKSQF